MALHGGTKNIKGVLHRGGKKPEATTVPYHAGSGKPKTGKTTDPPRPGTGVNAQNWAGQQVKPK